MVEGEGLKLQEQLPNLVFEILQGPENVLDGARDHPLKCLVPVHSLHRKGLSRTGLSIGKDTDVVAIQG